MAEYWVGPSLRQRRRAGWNVTPPASLNGHHERADRRLARPIVPRRWRAIVRLARTKRHDVTFLARYAGHGAVLVLAMVTGSLYGIDFASYLEPAPEIVVPESNGAATLWSQAPQEELVYLEWNAVPQTIIPERPATARYEPITYEVRAGDNPTTIAARFNLQPSTIVWANSEADINPDLLSIGQVLVIPPVDGILHTIAPGDSLETLATTYKVETAAITDYPGNQLADGEGTVAVGQQVIVPGGVRPYEQPKPVVAKAPATTAAKSTPAASAPTTSAPAASAPAASSGTTSTSSAAASSSNGWTYQGATGYFRWPVQGRITQSSSAWHTAIDIAAPMGTPVYASDGGKVIAAGWDTTGYGYRVMIDHGRGFRTLYGHFSYFYVNVGDYINKGDMIGRIGSTGQSTGPHLHFEVRKNNYRQNPWNYLP